MLQHFATFHTTLKTLSQNTIYMKFFHKMNPLVNRNSNETVPYMWHVRHAAECYWQSESKQAAIARTREIATHSRCSAIT